MFHSPFDQPGYRKKAKKKKKKAKARKKAPAKKKRAAKKAPARKKAKKKAPARKAKRVAKRTPAKKKAKKVRARETKIPRVRHKKGGTWSLTHIPTGIAANQGIKTKAAARQLAFDLDAIRGNRWGAGFSSIMKLKDKPLNKRPKWFLKAGEISKSVRKNPHVDPEWSGRGRGSVRWVKEDILVNSAEGLFVIEGEVLYPKRIWAISRTLSEGTAKNPPLRQLLMFKSRR